MEKRFKIGDVVRLRPSSTKMTVLDYATALHYDRERAIDEIEKIVVCKCFQADGPTGYQEHLSSDEFHEDTIEKMDV